MFNQVLESTRTTQQHIIWRGFILLTLFAVLILPTPLLAQVPELPNTTMFPATVFERLTVYAGPGDTYEIVGDLGAGVDVTITQRNHIGNWLHIEREATASVPEVDGWVLTGYLMLPDDFALADLQVTDVPDINTETITDPDLLRLYQQPILPAVSDAMIDVFERGQDMGNNADVVSKVGDSNSANPRFLEPLALGQIDLGPYTYLQDVIDVYGASFDKPNNAARIGLNAFSVFDPIWSHATRCQSEETPLACEYRTNKPAIAVIVFGQNDTRVLNSEQWETQMRLVIEQTLDAGVVPLVVTFSSDEESDVYQRAIQFNLILLDLAEEYEIPLLNFWSAARVLPNRGIGDDDAHLTGGGDIITLTGRESRDGVPLLNLMVLNALDIIHDALPY